MSKQITSAKQIEKWHVISNNNSEIYAQRILYLHSQYICLLHNLTVFREHDDK